MKKYILLFLLTACSPPVPSASPTPEAPKSPPVTEPTPPSSPVTSCTKPGEFQAADMATYSDEKLIDALKAGGITTMIRYYDWPGQETLKGKMPTKAEMELLKRKKMKHMRVFQHNNNKLTTFTAARGKIDAEHSIKQAREAGATEGRAIYFGVDGDFYTQADMKKVREYFAAATPLVRAAGFRVGMYGSGANCISLRDAKLIDGDLCWIAGASGWSRTKEVLASGKYALRQKVNQKCMGKSLDYNFVNLADFGQWELK